jgi:serine/threonine protein kinase
VWFAVCPTRPTARRSFKVEPEGNYDVAKLLDFGVAKFLDLGPSAATRAGVVCGTPYYLSPEQAQELPADARSDIYALGAVFYEMITGVVPFTGSSLLEILTGHVTGTVIPPSQRAPGRRDRSRTPTPWC